MLSDPVTGGKDQQAADSDGASRELTCYRIKPHGVGQQTAVPDDKRTHGLLVQATRDGQQAACGDGATRELNMRSHRLLD
jgi:hypothetical protein